MKLKNDQSGFIEVALAIVVVIVLAGAGYFAWQTFNKNDHKVSTTSPTVSSSPATSKTSTSTATPDLTASWTSFTSVSGKYSLRYNPSWKIYTYGGDALKTCQKDRTDSAQDFETKNTGDMLITGCGGGAIGQVHSGSSVGLKNTDFSGTTDLYDIQFVEKEKIDGVEGVRYSAIAKYGFPNIEKGGGVVEYHFYTNGRNYVISMEQHSLFPVIGDDFDLMVKTLKFID